MKFESGDTLLFIGDSITDCGRGRPVGEGDGLGGGYVGLAASLMATHYPERHVRILNTGISGNRIIDLHERWDTDVLALAPDWLSIKIGINDVWRQFDSPELERQVTLDEYERIARKLIKRTEEALSLKGLILMSPYVIEPDPDDPMRCRMDEYGAVVERLAGEYGATFVNVQKAFEEHLAHHPSESLCDDKIHPNLTGHMIIATCFLNAVGFEWLAGCGPSVAG